MDKNRKKTALGALASLLRRPQTVTIELTDVSGAVLKTARQYGDEVTELRADSRLELAQRLDQLADLLRARHRANDEGGVIIMLTRDK